MSFTKFAEQALPILETEMREVLESAKIQNDPSLYDMLAFHFGWNIPNSKQGKRIRPLILLLTNQVCGGDWQEAIPAASAIELLHNFSLIHDDIEDKSETRRGRTTLWKEYSLAIALNAGDSLYSLAYLGMQRLSLYKSPEITLQAVNVFTQTCLELTSGQHLDISFEHKNTVTVEQYWQMIRGKTAALLGACGQIGAITAGASQDKQNAFKQFGLNLGLAFQVHDDLLGIWGDPQVTGKSIASDLLAHKKSLPVLFGLEKEGEFFDLWNKGINAGNVELAASLLKNEGASDYTQEHVLRLTHQAMQSLHATQSSGEALESLKELLELLTKRKH